MGNGPIQNINASVYAAAQFQLVSEVFVKASLLMLEKKRVKQNKIPSFEANVQELEI